MVKDAVGVLLETWIVVFLFFSFVDVAVASLLLSPFMLVSPFLLLSSSLWFVLSVVIFCC